MATAAKITGQITRWWWVRHAPVPNPEARCYGQTDKDCDISNHALFEHQARLLPKGAVWYASNLLRARKTAETLASSRRRDERAADRPQPRRAAFRRLAGSHLCRDRREGQQSFVLARSAGIPPAGRRELRRPARPRGAQHRSSDRRASRPRHRGDGARRHHPCRPRARLRSASRGRGALRDRQRLAHPDRAFRAGRSGPCLARRLRELHAARAGHRPRRQAAALA